MSRSRKRSGCLLAHGEGAAPAGHGPHGQEHMHSCPQRGQPRPMSPPLGQRCDPTHPGVTDQSGTRIIRASAHSGFVDSAPVCFTCCVTGTALPFTARVPPSDLSRPCGGETRPEPSLARSGGPPLRASPLNAQVKEPFPVCPCGHRCPRLWSASGRGGGGRSRTGSDVTPGNGAKGWHGDKARNTAQPLPGKTSGGAAQTASVSL